MVVRIAREKSFQFSFGDERATAGLGADEHEIAEQMKPNASRPNWPEKLYGKRITLKRQHLSML